MAKKKVIGEDGKTYVMKEKKPFYKRVWFWILAVMILVVIGGSLGGGDESANGGEKVDTSSETESKPETEKADAEVEEKKEVFYAIGDTIAVGDAEYTLESVELTDERNQFDESNPAHVVKITYVVKNNGESDLPVGMDVEVYGSDDKKSESYPNDNSMGTVAPGKQMDMVAHFGLNQTGEIEIHIAPIISFEKSAIFKATI